MSNWVSVDTERPRIRQRVLILVKCSDYFNVEEGWYRGDGEWCNCWFDVRRNDIYPVTHWQPLPEPPEEE